MSNLRFPSVNEMIALLEHQELVIGLFLLGTGLVFLMLGLRVYRTLVVLSFGAIGLALGRQLPIADPLNWAVAGGIGLALAILSTRAVKAGVVALGAGWAGFIAAGLALRLGLSDTMALGFGGVALLLALALAFILYDQIIAFVTSFEGALLFIGGMIICFSHAPGAWAAIQPMLKDNLVLGPFFVLAGTVTGFYLQLSDLRRKEAGTSG